MSIYTFFIDGGRGQGKVPGGIRPETSRIMSCNISYLP